MTETLPDKVAVIYREWINEMERHRAAMDAIYSKAVERDLLDVFLFYCTEEAGADQKIDRNEVPVDSR